MSKQQQAWATRVDDVVVFQARFIGFDGGNSVVAPQKQGGIYIGLATSQVRWTGLMPGESIGPGHKGEISVPAWMLKFHWQLQKGLAP